MRLSTDVPVCQNVVFVDLFPIMGTLSVDLISGCTSDGIVSNSLSVRLGK